MSTFPCYENHGVRVGVLANRVRGNTLLYRALGRFLERLDLPLLGALRDTQRYPRAAERGMGICELHPASVARDEVVRWQPLLGWLESDDARIPAPPVRSAALA